MQKKNKTDKKTPHHHQKTKQTDFTVTSATFTVSWNACSICWTFTFLSCEMTRTDQQQRRNWMTLLPAVSAKSWTTVQVIFRGLKH